MNDYESYIYGLLITDGCLVLSDRNRGRVSLEVSIKDKDIINKLYKIIPDSKISTRTRKTNFSNEKEFITISFRNYRREFRTKLIDQGFPIKEKTINANIPNQPYEEYDFWRGVIDGDGSLGFIYGGGTPFLSLVTKSEFLKNSYLDFLKREFNITKNIKRNTRDKIYNITIKNEFAVKLSNKLYIETKSALYIDRKYYKAVQMQLWSR